MTAARRPATLHAIPPSAALARIPIVRAGVLDVGSNTVRLLVADVGADGVTPVTTDKAYVGLGAEIARVGSFSEESIRAVADVCRRYAEKARRHRADLSEVIVTAPGRQGEDGSALVAALRTATALPVRILSAREEGRLAFEGALARAGDLATGRIGVVDVGGGSTEIAVGTADRGAEWVDSVDLGSLRLTHLALPSDPPTKREIAAAREIVRRALAPLAPPQPGLALAAGGSARALAKLVGRTFGPDDVDRAVRILARRPAQKVARKFGIDAHRAATVLAGALVFGEVSETLGQPLTLARGGLREGAALALSRARDAAAA